MRPAAFTSIFLFAVTLPMAAQTTTTATASNTISACVGNLTGILREVSSSKDCLKGLETFQQFNITGPQGLQGVAGPAGPQGIAGAKGATGATGSTGAAGPQGIAGSQGPAGAPGAAGPQGPAGPMGMMGATGATGTPGATGATGAAGPKGDTGATGPIGLTGEAGPAGPVGATGAAGPKGDTGAAGAAGPMGAAGINYRGPFQSNVTYYQGDVVLVNGALYIDTAPGGTNDSGTLTPATDTNSFALLLPAGAAGATGAMGAVGINYRGSFTPNVTYYQNDVVLVNGALYIDTAPGGTNDSGTLTPATDTNSFALLLPAGATGPQGPTGATGATGDTGPAGPTGPQGATGAAGSNVGTIFSSNLVMNGTFTAVEFGPATGFATTLAASPNTSSIPGIATAIPTACTASNLTVTNFGAHITTRTELSVGLATTTDATGNGSFNFTDLQCTLVEPSNGTYSCQSNATVPIAAGTFVFILVNGSNPLVNNSRVIVGWNCN